MKADVLIPRYLGLCLLAAGGLLACSSDTSSTGIPNGGKGGAVGGSQATSSRVGSGGATAALGGGNGGNGIGAGGNLGTGGISIGQGGGTATGGASPGDAGVTADASVQGGAGGKFSSTGGTTALGGKSGSGGAATGGAATGGTATGGTATGGSTAGGAGSGGAATGGKSGTGGSGAGGKSGTGGSSATTTLCPGATQTITVAASGGQYTTVQAAINAISSSNNKLVQVSVAAGTYNEKVTISKPFVCLTGAGATTTTITNANGTNIVTGGTVIVTGNDFSAANIAFENSGANGSGQAVALMAQGQRQQFFNCRFLSYQDTLYTNTGTQYFKDCYIQGDTDYIFGDATAIFENCTMNNIAEGTAVTAPRTPQNTTYGFVFLGGSLTANPTTSTVRSNHVYLGRPWGPYAAAAFLNVTIGAHIATAGWTTMSGNDLSQTRFSEYKSTGAGANTTDGTRAPRQLTDAQAANYTVKNVLNPWLPGYSQ